MADLPQWANFQFPDFGIQGFPYQNLPAQLIASMQRPTGLTSYGRFNGTGVSGTGGLLNPPPAGNNPGTQPTPIPGAQVGPGGTYPMPKDPRFISPGMRPVGPIVNNPPSMSSGVTSVGPGGGIAPIVRDPNNTPTLPPFVFNLPSPTAPPPSGAGSPLDTNNKMKTAQSVPASTGLLSDPNFGQAPSIPSGGSNQAFSSNFMPNAAAGPGSLGAQQAHYLAARPNSLQAQKMAALPQSFTPGQFNNVAKINPVLAEQMLGAGGQPYMTAVAQQNGWTPQQMNSFINTYGSGATPGFGPEQLALLASMGIR